MTKLLSLLILCSSFQIFAATVEEIKGSYIGVTGDGLKCSLKIEIYGQNVYLEISQDDPEYYGIKMQYIDLQDANETLGDFRERFILDEPSQWSKEARFEIKNASLTGAKVDYYIASSFGPMLKRQINCIRLRKN